MFWDQDRFIAKGKLSPVPGAFLIQSKKELFSRNISLNLMSNTFPTMWNEVKSKQDQMNQKRYKVFLLIDFISGERLNKQSQI